MKEQKKRRKSLKERGVDLNDQGLPETDEVNAKTSKKAKLAALKYRLSKQED